MLQVSRVLELVGKAAGLPYLTCLSPSQAACAPCSNLQAALADTSTAGTVLHAAHRQLSLAYIGAQALSMCRGLTGSSRGTGSSKTLGSARERSWEIEPTRIQVARQPDGQLLKLGSGAFGTVR